MVWQNGVQQLYERERKSPAIFRRAKSKAHSRGFPAQFPLISRERPWWMPLSIPVSSRFPTGSQPFPGSYSGIPTVSLKTSSLFPAATLPFLKRDMTFSLDGPKADRRG